MTVLKPGRHSVSVTRPLASPPASPPPAPTVLGAPRPRPAFVPLFGPEAQRAGGSELPQTAAVAPESNTVAPESDAEPPAEPRVELEREGELVRTIRVHCSCGERIEIACDYEGGAS
ncbi:MAG: hypothetical protein D6776_04900 [Planctomycetota bacterium]|nr:MAG: hypothetical protein D6776_04900 [Planctomycetota bacterium]